MGATRNAVIHRWVAPISFATVAEAFSIALLLYLPLENGLTGGISGSAQWVVRLLPDALICALAAAAILGSAGDPRARVALVILACAAATIVAADVARGHSPSDSINAIRVVIRYLALGAVLVTVGAPRRSSRDLVLRVVIGIGIVQVLAALVEVIAAGSAFGWSNLPALAGTTGRYDRLGLLVAALALAGLAVAAERPRRWHAGLLAVALLVLFLTTSRQAMVAVAAGSLVFLILPNLAAVVRAGAAASVLAVAVMVVMIGGRGAEPLTGEGSSSGVAPISGVQGVDEPVFVSPPRALGSSTLSLDANRNLRLYLTLVLAPWAAAQEPLFGLGPGRHDAVNADPRLRSKLVADGMSWSYARRFMNDSNYASLAVQFGILAPVLFLATLIAVLAVIMRSLLRRMDTLGLFSLAFGIAILIAAFFGPAFEIRPTSAILWIAACLSLRTVRLA